MKVLLIKDVENLGWLGDVVEVKTGYARNYLLPQGLANVPTEGNMRAIAKDKAIAAQKRIEDRKHFEAAAKAVDGAEVVLSAAANESGHLFGSITAAMIADNLRQQGFAVADSIVKLGQHIKEVGTSQVTLKFAEGLTAAVNVVVVAGQDENSEPAEKE